MSSRKNRTKRQVHIGARSRRKIRRKLVSIWGNECCWCGEKMEIPHIGKPVENLENLATIEHHFAIKFGDPDNIAFLQLAHKKCNK